MSFLLCYSQYILKEQSRSLMHSMQASVECTFDVIPACWYLHLLGVAITSNQGGPQRQQYEWASEKIWRSPHSHHSPPEPDASHTPTVARQGQCTEKSDYIACLQWFIHCIAVTEYGTGQMETCFLQQHELVGGKRVTRYSGSRISFLPELQSST